MKSVFLLFASVLSCLTHAMELEISGNKISGNHLQQLSELVSQGKSVNSAIKTSDTMLDLKQFDGRWVAKDDFETVFTAATKA